ncbi:hypothetical protein M406DRAFT_338336 [Cryphonectria parasitica EP155]|uniref:Large ribosomal subunit protein uL23m n=1 Tax=Cryphonectria parasitica (strain ATCC 38755 / EP155) TaxID=660469 RepID=A0A9P5CRJ5_CRYP1|nr:uncharacterized protein M406DRAFT_338336 [Cryphonectria parasitica EP155]KAF3767597.1 hypothetical protein M406DRAFT_338336 [Cryphonectria parasitica EP155]
MATKAVAKAADTAVEGIARKAPFRLGQKQVYLPNHIITFLRPKEGQSPTTATFQVPLTFNKLDFRDYLYNVYDVEVNSVRSFINQKRPQQRSLGGMGGRWYRPRSQKLMIVDLKKPFVWPERPAEEDMAPWDHALFKNVEGGHEKDVSEAERRVRGTPVLRMYDEKDLDRARLAKRAKELLEGKRKWTPGSEWGELETTAGATSEKDVKRP